MNTLLFQELIQSRTYLSIQVVEDYTIRLQRGEKKRDIEKSAVKQALFSMGLDTGIGYKESGQPYLEKYTHLHVSISHSKEWIAVYVSDRPVGIDIEHLNPRIVQGSTYFLNNDEIQYATNSLLLHIVWGAKEAFFKWMEGTIDDLKNDVTIRSIDQQNVHIFYNEKMHSFEWVQHDGITVVLN